MSDVEQVTASPAPEEVKPLPTFAEQAKAALPTEVASPVAAPEVPVAPVAPEAPKSRVFANYFQQQYGADLGDVSADCSPEFDRSAEPNPRH